MNYQRLIRNESNTVVVVVVVVVHADGRFVDQRLNCSAIDELNKTRSSRVRRRRATALATRRCRSLALVVGERRDSRATRRDAAPRGRRRSQPRQSVADSRQVARLAQQSCAASVQH